MAYAKIFDNFWSCPERARLPDEVRLLMLYLFTNKHRNAIGLYRLPAAYAAEDIGWEREKVLRVLKKLPPDFAVYDEKTGHVLIRTYLLWNGPQNSNMVRHCIEQLATVSDSPLMQAFLEDASVYCVEDWKSIIPDTAANLLVPMERAEKAKVLQPGIPEVESQTQDDEEAGDTEKETTSSAKEKPQKQSKKPSVKDMTDEEFVAYLRGAKAYEGIDIDSELSKIEVYCTANSKTATKRYIVNWLNRTNTNFRPVKQAARPGLTPIGAKNMATAQAAIERRQNRS